jgi:hypothetical protein
MHCLLVDPYFFYVDTQHITPGALERFLARIGAWSALADNDHILFGMTDECRRLVKFWMRDVLSQSKLQGLVEHHLPRVPVDSLMKTLMPVIDRLTSPTALDKALGNWLEVAPSALQPNSVLISPKDFLDRINDPNLQNAFRTMLGNVFIAKKNQHLFIPQVQNVQLLSYFHEYEEWHKVAEQRLVIGVKTPDDLPKNWIPQTGKAVDLIEELLMFTNPEEIQKLLPPTRYANAAEAVRAVMQLYPQQVYYANPKMDNTSNHEANLIYRLVRGLVMDWLPMFVREGQDRANAHYYTRYSKECASGISDKTKQEHGEEYLVNFEGEMVACVRHVKIGVGKYGKRIYFQAIQRDGDWKIIIASASQHKGTSGYKS